VISIPQSAKADDGTLITLVATIDSTADADKRNVLFSASSGGFVGGKDSSISMLAEFRNGRSER